MGRLSTGSNPPLATTSDTVFYAASSSPKQLNQSLAFTRRCKQRFPGNGIVLLYDRGFWRVFLDSFARAKVVCPIVRPRRTLSMHPIGGLH